jgi:hypothetical protein
MYKLSVVLATLASTWKSKRKMSPCTECGTDSDVQDEKGVCQSCVLGETRFPPSMAQLEAAKQNKKKENVF